MSAHDIPEHWLKIDTAPRDGTIFRGMWMARERSLGFGKVRWSLEQQGWVGADDNPVDGVLVEPTHWTPALETVQVTKDEFAAMVANMEAYPPLPKRR